MNACEGEMKMKKKEKMYAIIFDKHANFKEIRTLSESNEPLIVNSKSMSGSIYICNQKEFARLIESAMKHFTSLLETDSNVDKNDDFADMGQQIVLPNGGVGYIKGDIKHFNGSAEADVIRAAPTTSDSADAAKADKLNKWTD